MLQTLGVQKMFVDVYDSIPAYSTGSTPFKKQCAVILQTKSSSFVAVAVAKIDLYSSNDNDRQTDE